MAKQQAKLPPSEGGSGPGLRWIQGRAALGGLLPNGWFVSL